MQVSSTYKMTKTWLQEFGSIEMEKDILVQNAPNPPATIALLAGKRVDASLTWEHSLSLGLNRVKGSEVFLNVGDYYKSHTKRNMPYFCVAMNANTIKKLPKDAVSRIAAAYADNMNWIMNNRDNYAARATQLKIDPAVIRTAMDSGRLSLQMQSMADAESRKDILLAAEILQKAQFFPKKLDEGVFAA
jgi:ABC-type nitrate/sulfonate/bicarbonate transport system substrate-binding protein